MPNLQAGQFPRVVPENRSPIMFAIAVRVFQNDDAVAETAIESARSTTGPTVVLGDPQSTALVGRHRDGVLDIGLTREDRELKTFRQPRGSHDFVRRHWGRGRLLGIRRKFKLVSRADRNGSDSQTQQ
jgi:hypothetical protein